MKREINCPFEFFNMKKVKTFFKIGTSFQLEINLE